MQLPERNRVVIVDDDPAIRGALKFSLEQEGYHVSVFDSASALLAERTLPDGACLVVDYIMPRMNGLEMLEALRKRGMRPPAILISSSISRVLRQRGAKLGVRHFLEKPLIGGSFLEAIHSVLTV